MSTDAQADLMARARGISLGLFAADLGNLEEAAQSAIQWGCDILHFDVMDGVFVPQMMGGPGFVAALDMGALSDAHLMVQNPADHVEGYVMAGADMITVHAESTGAADAIDAIRGASENAGRPVMAGLALMPGTSLEDAGDLLAMEPDMVLVLSLDPRTNNPPDITSACKRIAELRALPALRGSVLAFDGGVTLDSIQEIAAARPDMIVSGSAVLRAPDPKVAYQAMAAAME